jgi:hypothetical protein
MACQAWGLGLWALWVIKRFRFCGVVTPCGTQPFPSHGPWQTPKEKDAPHRSCQVDFRWQMALRRCWPKLKLLEFGAQGNLHKAAWLHKTTMEAVIGSTTTPTGGSFSNERSWNWQFHSCSSPRPPNPSKLHPPRPPLSCDLSQAEKNFDFERLLRSDSQAEIWRSETLALSGDFPGRLR